MHRVSVFATMSVFIAFCAAAQEAPKPLAVPADKAQVFVYRYKQFVGKGLRPSIYCNESDVARIQSGRFVALELTPGSYRFRSNDKQSQVELELKPGQQYYIRIDIATGMLKGHGRLTLVLPEQGAGELKQMKPADADMVKDSKFLAPGFTPTK